MLEQRLLQGVLMIGCTFGEPYLRGRNEPGGGATRRDRVPGRHGRGMGRGDPLAAGVRGDENEYGTSRPSIRARTLRSPKDLPPVAGRLSVPDGLEAVLDTHRDAPAGASRHDRHAALVDVGIFDVSDTFYHVIFGFSINNQVDTLS